MFKSVHSVVISVLYLAVSVLADSEGNFTCKGEKVSGFVFLVGKSECYLKMFPMPTKSPTGKSKDNTSARKEMIKNLKENELCLDVCAWKIQGMLSADGSFNKNGTEKFFKAYFPAKVQSDMEKGISECWSANSKSLTTDNKCASYRGFKDCKTKKLIQVCEIKDGKSPEREIN